MSILTETYYVQERGFIFLVGCLITHLMQTCWVNILFCTLNVDTLAMQFPTFPLTVTLLSLIIVVWKWWIIVVNSRSKSFCSNIDTWTVICLILLFHLQQTLTTTLLLHLSKYDFHSFSNIFLGDFLIGLMSILYKVFLFSFSCLLIYFYSRCHLFCHWLL